MKRVNRILAALAIAVLIGTLSLLLFLRQQTAQEVSRSIARTQQALRSSQILHGPGGDAEVHFEALELVLDQARQSPYFKDLRVTKLVSEGGGRPVEIPIDPIKLRVEKGAAWKADMTGWLQVPLEGEGSNPWGYLYIDPDPALPRTLNYAFGTTSLAIALMLITLLARLWSQETSLTRTMIELSERRSELIRVERLALAGQLAAGLLHDLRKPVLNIQHGLDDLTAALGDFAPAAPALADQRRQVKLFFQILSESQMERFVQSDKVGEEFLDIAPLLDFSLNLVRYERRAVEVQRNEADGLPPILGQPFRLIQLFSNLILNAYQAMGGQGRLAINAEPTLEPPPAAAGKGSARAAHPPQRPRPLGTGGIEVRFSDSGPGISAENLDKVFDPFFTTKPEGQGTGLGLSICRMIAEDLGGQLSVESPPGGGATFKVWLPAEVEPEAPAQGGS